MLTLLLLAAVLGAGAQGAAPVLAPLESPSVVAFELGEDSDLRHEYFELRQDGAYVGRVVSTVGMRGGSLRAEMQLDLGPIATRVHHVERITTRGPRLVWREMRERSGRTVMAEWSEDGERLIDIAWNGGDAVRRETTPPAGALLPLFLVDSVRSGGFPSGAFDVFLPTSGSVEELQVRVESLPGAAVGKGLLSLRRLALCRADGTLAGEYLFAAGELLAFRVQDGGPVAVRVSHETYREREREDERLREESRSKDAG